MNSTFSSIFFLQLFWESVVKIFQVSNSKNRGAQRNWWIHEEGVCVEFFQKTTFNWWKNDQSNFKQFEGKFKKFSKGGGWTRKFQKWGYLDICWCTNSSKDNLSLKRIPFYGYFLVSVVDVNCSDSWTWNEPRQRSSDVFSLLFNLFFNRMFVIVSHHTNGTRVRVSEPRSLRFDVFKMLLTYRYTISKKH